MKEIEKCKFILKALCVINRTTIIINKILSEEELTENEKIIIKEIIKMKGTEEV